MDGLSGKAVKKKSFCYSPDLPCWVHTMWHCIKPLQSAAALLGPWLFLQACKMVCAGIVFEQYNQAM